MCPHAVRTGAATVTTAESSPRAVAPQGPPGYVQPVVSRVSRWLMAALLAASIGGHWMLLQSVAWVEMVVSYSEQVPLSQALAQTFDGEHPCPLCKVIAAAKKHEQHPLFSLRIQKLEFPPLTDPFKLISPRTVPPSPTPPASAASWSRKPPLPPPRALWSLA